LFERYLDVSAKDDPARATAERYVREIHAETAAASQTTAHASAQ
jgi:hypothetical protein